jgi:hypothetical protein
VLQLDDIHNARKLRKDVPDYLISNGSQGNVIIFHKDDLEHFLDIPLTRSRTPNSFFRTFFCQRRT